MAKGKVKGGDGENRCERCDMRAPAGAKYCRACARLMNRDEAEEVLSELARGDVGPPLHRQTGALSRGQIIGGCGAAIVAALFIPFLLWQASRPTSSASQASTDDERFQAPAPPPTQEAPAALTSTPGFAVPATPEARAAR